MRLPNLNLRYKLFLILLSSLLLGLGVVGTALYFQFESFLYQRVKNITATYLDLAAQSIDNEKIIADESLYLKGFVDIIATKTACRVTIIDQDGKVLADSEIPIISLPMVENHINRPEIQTSLHTSYGFDLRTSQTIKEKLLYVSKAVYQEDVHIGFLRLAVFSNSTNEMLTTARRYFIVAGLLIFVLSALFIMPLSRNITENIKDLGFKARQIADGDLDVRIKLRTNDELKELGSSLNEMAIKISGYLRRLAQERQDLNTVLSSINEGIIAIQANQRIIFFNNQALKLLDCHEETILEKDYHQIIENKHLTSLLDNFFKKPFLISDEIELSRDKILEISMIPFNLQDIQRKGVVLVLRDISHYKKLEKIRRDFVANVSHEFKTPLAAVRGYSETLLDWGLEEPEMSRKYIQKIIKQSHQLENLVSDLLQLARIERLQNIELKAFQPDDIVNDVISQYMELAQAKDLQLTVKLQSERYQILGEPEMFRSIIANLVDNAVKYSTQGGKILVHTQINGAYCIFSVQDTGIGIPEKEQGRIFERFYRVDKARSRQIGGTGLGLSIVKHLAELQNAEIWMQSKVDTGSIFSVKFPLSASAAVS